MEDLKKLFERQAEQQREIFRFSGDPDALTRRKIVEDNLLGIYEEVAELQALVYKGEHVIGRIEPTKSNLAIAGVDVAKYLFSILSAYGITASEFHSAFMTKSDVVSDKLRQQRAKIAQSEFVIVTDLDDVVANWTDGFDRWLNLRSHKPVKDLSMFELENAKELFYDEGGFATLDVIPKAVEVLKQIRLLGLKLVIVTARPRIQHERIYADTMTWLRKHSIEYDAIFWGKNKADIVFEQVRPATVLYFIEDRPKHVIELSGVRIPVLMFPTKENREFNIFGTTAQRVADWNEVFEIVNKKNMELKSASKQST